MTPRTRLVLRMVVGASLLAFVLSRARWSQMSVTLGPALLLKVGATAALLMLAQFLSAVRWRVILGGRAPIGYLWRLYMIGSFFSLFLPTLVGGDAVRAAAASRTAANPGAALASVVTERMLGVLALAVYLLIGLAVAPGLIASSRAQFHWTLPPWAMAVGIAGAILGIAAVLLAWRYSAKLRTFVAEARSIFDRLRSVPGTFGGAVALGFLVQAVHMTVWFQLAMSLHLPVPARAFFVLVPLITLAGMMPVSIAGIGVREGAWVVLLAPFGIRSADAVAYSLLYFIGVLIVGLIGGLMFIVFGTELAATPDRERA
jgi:uncharacterized membrane protein YbhN (UPF0104 family)